MDKFDIYNDIAVRTSGDIYVGVVGPVRTGKSTFIRNFMEKMVVDKIANKSERQRVIDELPQSGAGKTIMTTQPKFVPNKAVRVALAGTNEANVRLIDCVGYMVDGANGLYEEDGTDRLVKTPWSDQDLAFNTAAELGTSKVIKEHSSIAILVTTDGTITDIDRKNYINAEERIVEELKANKKPFVIVLNSKTPYDKSAQKLKTELEQKYDTKVLAFDVSNMTEEDIDNTFESILSEFYITQINIELPKWVRALSFESNLIQNVLNNLQTMFVDAQKMADITKGNLLALDENSVFDSVFVDKIDYGTGKVNIKANVKKELFYKMLSAECGTTIDDDFYLMSYLKLLTSAKKEYDKIKGALDEVTEKGYGVVVPTLDDMNLAEPEIVKKGGMSQVKLKATAPSLHIMRVDVETEVCPAVGSPEQSESIAKYMLKEYEENPKSVWETNMFGKTLSEFVKDGIQTKINNIPKEAQIKMRKTMTKIVNEGKGGIICILL